MNYGAENRRKRHGMALVVTLLVLSLMVVLSLAMMGTAGQALRRSGREGAVVRTTVLEELVTSLAVAQLRSATSGVGDDGALVPWASQPGAVRTFAEDGALGALFKLYSAREMVVAGDAELDADVPVDWNRRPGEFVDLNAPVVSEGSGGEQRLKFPVVDPRAKRSGGERSVEGFDYGVGKVVPSGVVGPEAGPGGQRLPMPVRWLYVLKDGTLGEEGASEMNPIVGRVAFWTDDESSKVNVNTASEGVAWDTPRTSTEQDRALSDFQPVRGEFQRFPGHPAMVSLSSVLVPGQRFYGAGMEPRDGGMEEMDRDVIDALWELAPGVSADRKLLSAGGSQRAGLLDGAGEPEGGELFRYGSAGELLMAKTRGEKNRLFEKRPEAIERLAQGKFFLTADSSAPEVTLWGTPRVAMWPVHGSLDPATGEIKSVTNKVTAYDQKVALMSFLGGRKYYVTRNQAWDGWGDFQAYGNGIQENGRLLDYLRGLTDRAVPGFGEGTFADKYGAGRGDDRENLLVSMLDYIRATNLNDGGLGGDEQFCVVCAGQEHVGFGQVTPLVTASPRSGATEAVQGLGRIATLSEVAFVFSCRAEVLDNGEIAGRPSARNRKKLVDPGDRELEVSILLEAFVPGQGWGEYRPYLSVLAGGLSGDEEGEVDGRLLPRMEVCGQELVLAQETAESGFELPANWRASGGSAGVRLLLEEVLAFEPVVVKGAVEEFSFSGTVGQGGMLGLSIYDTPESAGSRGGSSDLVQTIPVAAPVIAAGKVPMPTVPGDGVAARLSDRVRDAGDGRGLLSESDVVQSLVPAHGDYRLVAGRRFVGGARPVFVGHPGWGELRMAHSLREPVVEAERAVLGSAAGELDWRRGEASGLVPGVVKRRGVLEDFAVRPGDENARIRWVGNTGELKESKPGDVFDMGRLDHGVRGSCLPWETGDFDNGIGAAPDGAYVNRADDGRQSYFGVGEPDEDAVPSPVAASFSPQRMVPSPVMFGSLPTGVRAQVPWQTLLFRPQAGHYGEALVADYHLLDLFWMPVVEPRPLGRPFETEGKINLNYAIVPFSYIERKTGLHALMKAETMLAIPDTDSEDYKRADGTFHDGRYRHFIDVGETLRVWDEEVFGRGRVFRSAGEVCGMPLVPEGESGGREAMAAFWSKHRLTGDNSRERPYANLYPRLTTRSNSFRLHYVVQSLEKVRSSDGGGWVEGVDRVVGEVRGARLLAREIDPLRDDIPDYTAAEPEGGRKPLDRYYHWRVGAPERF